MKTTLKKSKNRFGKYPTILIRADEDNRAWFERRRNMADMTANELLSELRKQDERREVANAAKRAKRGN